MQTTNSQKSHVLVTFCVDSLSLSVLSEISFNFSPSADIFFKLCFKVITIFQIEGFGLHNSWHNFYIHMHVHNLHMFTIFLPCKLTLKMFKYRVVGQSKAINIIFFSNSYIIMIISDVLGSYIKQSFKQVTSFSVAVAV